MSVFDKWNKAIDVEGLAKDTKEVEANGGTGEYAEIPVGTYEIKIEKMELKEKEIFVEERKGIVRFLDLPKEEQNRLLQKNQAYGQIVCRCEQITEGEILDAIHRPLGATTLDGVKRRTRAGMGRCQAGFCTPKVMEILARELHLELKDIRKNGRRDAR